jgi:hypothetical protein
LTAEAGVGAGTNPGEDEEEGTRFPNNPLLSDTFLCP